MALHVDGAWSRARKRSSPRCSTSSASRCCAGRKVRCTAESVGGSINLITAKPTDELSGYGAFPTATQLHQLRGRGLRPLLSDRVLGHIAVKSEDHDGFGDNPVTGGEVDDLDRKMVRGRLQFNLGGSADVLLSGKYYDQEDQSRALKFRRDAFPVRPPDRGRMPAGRQPLHLCQGSARPRLGDRPVHQTETWAVTASSTGASATTSRS